MLDNRGAPASATSLQTTFAGFAAAFLGIGVARFSLSALGARWLEDGPLSRRELSTVSAVGLVSFAIGAAAAPGLARRFGARGAARWTAGALAAALGLECIGEAPILVATRAALGALGAVLMILGPALALEGVAGPRRGWIASWVFMGIGAGALASSALVRATAPFGAWTASAALAATSLVMAVAMGWAWPADRKVEREGPLIPSPRPTSSRGVVHLQIAYGAMAVGYVPCSVFLASHVSLDLGLGPAVAAHVAMAFGAGGVPGAFLAGGIRHLVSDHVPVPGDPRAPSRDGRLAPARERVRWVVPGLLLTYAGATLAVVIVRGPWQVELLAFVAGALTPALVAATAARLADLSPHGFQARWATTTATFALLQAVSGAGMAALSAASGSDVPLFAVGGAVLCFGALSASLPPRHRRGVTQEKYATRGLG